jgi:hypothetical protein
MAIKITTATKKAFAIPLDVKPSCTGAFGRSVAFSVPKLGVGETVKFISENKENIVVCEKNSTTLLQRFRFLMIWTQQ